MASTLLAGAAAADITPNRSMFLFGYPHVPRNSTGVHDPLLSSALFLSDGSTPLLLIANDVIYVNRQTARNARERIARQTGVPVGNIMITATHTHSGPMTCDMLAGEGDPVVPKTDPRYVEQLEDGIVRAGVEAFQNARRAKLGMAVADSSCVGGNRHDPAGPSNPAMPVFVVRSAADDAYIALMLVCSMHPTVLHEDSTLISGDFPAMTRQYLQRLFGGCPVIHHTGPCGNQSPRHVTRANTFDEAARLGELLGRAAAEVIPTVELFENLPLGCDRAWVDLPPREFPTVEQAESDLHRAAERFKTLRESNADRREVRTAECDWFGAEETLALARAAADGRLQQAFDAMTPAEITLMHIGPWSLAGWPGECFVEFSLAVRKEYPNCHVVSMANGELQGYLVTEEAVRNRWYEAMNSLFANPAAGMAIVRTTLQLLSARKALFP